MLVVMAVALASVIVLRVTQPFEPEPVYQGKKLSEWVIKERRQEVSEAIRQAGTNAIPVLLRMLSANDSPLKAKLMELAQKQHIIKIQYIPAVLWNAYGCWGFDLLGADGQSAVPALINIADENISPKCQIYAIQSLAYIGPSAKKAVPALLRWATNANEEVRYHAKSSLRRIDPEAAAKAGIK